MTRITKPLRFTLLFSFVKWFLLTSFVLRLVFMFWQFQDVSWHVVDVLRTLLTGFLFDIGSVAFVTLPAVLYFVLLPNRIVGSRFDRIVTWFFFSLTVFLMSFTFLAEVTFWEEFRTRFN